MSRLNDRDAWVVLAALDGVGPELFGALVAEFGSAADVLDAAAGDGVRRWAKLQPATVRAALTRRDLLARLKQARDAAPDQLRALAERGLWSVTPLDVDYPAGLRDLDPPPPLLVGSGSRSLLAARRSVAVVGTRRPTPAGRSLAASITRRLVECRVLVVSGLAVGIDGVAHATALDRGGETIGVIGGGHDHPGPRAHAALRQRLVAAGGAILSEYSPETMPSKGTYPRRNRIIAALAGATVVVEAPIRSGALITARDALALGRPVFVAPSRVGDWAAAGSLALLRETPARIIGGLDELTEDLGLFESPVDEGMGPADGHTWIGALALLGEAERAVAERLRRAPAGLDVLVGDTGLAPSVVSGAVTLLLIRGWIEPVGPAYIPAGPLLR